MTGVGTAALVLAIIGTGTKAASSVKAGNAAKRLGDVNASLAESQAVDAENRGVRDATLFTEQKNVLEGQQRAGFASQNVDVNSGSPVAVKADAEALAARDLETIRLNATREAWGYRTQAEDYRQRGQVDQNAGRFDALSTLVGTGGSLLSQRYGYGSGKGKP